MPRVSRNVAQRYANAAKNKPKRRGEAQAPIRPPIQPTGPVDVPAGLASPTPLDLAPEREAVVRPARAARAEARAAARGEPRTAARRLVTAPTIDYSYVAGDLRRIGLVAGLLLLVLVALTFVPGLH